MEVQMRLIMEFTHHDFPRALPNLNTPPEYLQPRRPHLNHLNLPCREHLGASQVSGHLKGSPLFGCRAEHPAPDEREQVGEGDLREGGKSPPMSGSKSERGT